MQENSIEYLSYDESVFGDVERVFAEQVNGKKTRVKGHLVSLDDISPDGDASESVVADLASMYNWKKIVSESELLVLQRMQVNVLHIALGHVLDNMKVSAMRRLILQLLYVNRLTLEQIRETDDFAVLPRDTFDKRVFDARGELRKKARELWRLVMPDGEEAGEREVCMLWAALSNKATNWKMVKALQKRAAEMIDRLQ